MAHLGSWDIDDLLTFPAQTFSPTTDEPNDADGAPAYRVYEDETTAPILTGTMATLDAANTDGFYSEQITLSAANGFEAGKCYTIRITATVGGVDGAMFHTFQIGAKVNAGDGSGFTDIPWNSAEWDTPAENACTAAITAADFATEAEVAAAVLTAADADPITANATAINGVTGNSLDGLTTLGSDYFSDGWIDSNVSAIEDSEGAALALVPVHSGSAVTGTGSTIELDAGASDTDDFYNGLVIRTWKTDVVGVRQVRRITDYNGTTKVATITPDWSVNPDAQTVFQITDDGRVETTAIAAGAITSTVAPNLDAAVSGVPAAWGASIIGNGRTRDMFLQGFSNRIVFADDGLTFTVYSTDDLTPLGAGVSARHLANVGGLKSIDPT